jgi:hypothetical protein
MGTCARRILCGIPILMSIGRSAMKVATIRALRRVKALTPVEWTAVAEQARFAGVGGWRWDGPWQAAAAGHDAGELAFRLARDAGASPAAAAAAAGAVASVEADDLREEDRAVLVSGLGGLTDERAISADRFEEIWTGLRRFRPTLKPAG